MQLSDITRMAHTILEQQKIESDFIEYKKSASFNDTILKTACAFANNYMNREIGLIFIGVEEIDDPESGEKAAPKRPISGLKEAEIEPIENQLKQLLSEIHPRISYHLITDEIDDRSYLVIAVEPGSAGPYETSERAEKNKKIGLKAGRYIRVKRDTRLPNKREEFELLKKFADVHFSSELNETATLDDLNYEYMKEYLVATNARQDIRELPKLDMARSMGLVSESSYGGYRARNFAVLMFANRPQDFIPYARVEIIREAVGTDKMTSQVFDGPVWIQAERVIRYFEETVLRSYTIREADKTGHRIVYNWPRTMFAELATNCILHKDYDIKNYIGIYVYDDRITFVNHNRPLPPVTIESLNSEIKFDERNYLNPELKDMFFALNLIESYGSGIRRAKNAMAENHSPELVFAPANDDDEYTMATAYINPEFAAIRAEEEKQNDLLESTDRDYSKTTKKQPKNNQKAAKTTENLIKKRMLKNPYVTRQELAKELGVPETNVRYQIESLKKKGVIERIGSKNGGYWKVNDV